MKGFLAWGESNPEIIWIPEPSIAVFRAPDQINIRQFSTLPLWQNNNYTWTGKGFLALGEMVSSIRFLVIAAKIYKQEIF
jgi:hypothetical protein